MELAKIYIEETGFMAVTHNMPCAICQEQHAVYFTNEGRFDPCWDCQARGYYVGHPNRLLLRFFKWVGWL